MNEEVVEVIVLVGHLETLNAFVFFFFQLVPFAFTRG